MDNFERYAERVLKKLPPAKQLDSTGFESPLEVVWRQTDGLSDGQLVSVGEEHAATAASNRPALSEEETDEVESGVLASGIEALAFYKSIHFRRRPPFSGHWGIFIFDHALAYLAAEISERNKGSGMTFEESERLGYRLLLAHELFHFRFDCWAIAHESATQMPLYEEYQNSVYRKFHPLPLVCEETLANLHALNAMKGSGAYGYAKQFMLSQPGAYAEIVCARRDRLLAWLAAQAMFGFICTIGPKPGELPEHVPYLANPRRPNVTDAWCPQYVISGIAPSRLVVPGISLPTLKELENGFICKYLDGRKVRVSDHKYYKIDNGARVKMPNPHHKTVKLNEFKNVLLKAGMQQKDYFEERENTKTWKVGVPRVDTRSPKGSE